MRKIGMFALAVVLTTGASSAFGAALVALAPYGTETSSTASSVTPDGQWIVGNSGGGENRGVLWSVSNPSAPINVLGGGMQSGYLRGVAYRTEPYQGRQELVMLGKTNGTVGPTYWMYRPSDGTWGPKLRHTSEANSLPASNGLASHATQSDAVLAAWGAGSSGGASKVGKVWGGTDTIAPSTSYDTKSTTQESQMQAVSSSGRAVGWRKDSSSTYKQNYVLDFVDDGVAGTPGNFYFNGLDGTTKGEAWAVSANGTRVGGWSPVSGRTGNWPYIVDNPGASQTITELPHLNPGDTPSASTIVYGMSADGNWAVGRDYSYGSDKAVLWDLRDASPANWTELDLTAWATGQGILGTFTQLERAYSVGVDGLGNPVIVGYGTTTAGTRGFALTIPEPATLALLLLGLPLFRRRR